MCPCDFGSPALFVFPDPKGSSAPLPRTEGKHNKAENQPVLQRSPRAVPLSGSPPGRVKAVWFHVTGDLRTQRLQGAVVAM